MIYDGSSETFFSVVGFLWGVINSTDGADFSTEQWLCILWYICRRIRCFTYDVAKCFICFQSFILETPREKYFQHWNVIVSVAMVAASKVFGEPTCLTDTAVKCYIMAFLVDDFNRGAQTTTWICYITRATFGMSIEEISYLSLYDTESPLIQQGYLRGAREWWAPIFDGIRSKIVRDYDSFREKQCPSFFKPFVQRRDVYVYRKDASPFSADEEEHILEVYLQETFHILQILSRFPDYKKRCCFETFFNFHELYNDVVKQKLYTQVWSKFCESDFLGKLVSEQNEKMEPFYKGDVVNMTASITDIYLNDLRALATWRRRMSHACEAPWNMLEHSVRPMVKEEDMDTNFKLVNSKLQPESHSPP